MAKYLIRRLLHGAFSIIAVVIIVMVMIYSLLKRDAVLMQQPIYSKKRLNAKEVLKYSLFKAYGYVDFADYVDYINDLKNQGQISEEDAQIALDYSDTGAKSEKYVVDTDNAVAKKYIQSFADMYASQGYTIYRMNTVYRSAGKVDEGGQKELIAYRDVPLITRIFRYFFGLVKVDNMYYAKGIDDSERSIYFTFNDPAYGGAFAPAVMGNGTEYKYLLYFDGEFPFIHQNLVKLNLGISYSISSGTELYNYMTRKQGGLVQSEVLYPTGNVMETSDDIHTLRYVEGSYGENPISIIAQKYVDDYTNVSSKVNGNSKIGYSFVIGIISTIIAYLIGIPIGILMARHKNGIVDKIGVIYIIFIIATPSLAYIFMFREIGGDLFGLPTYFFTDTLHAAQYGLSVYVLPIISLALPSIAGLMQWIRRFMIDQMNADYVKFARSGGLSENEIFFKHISKNAMIPIVHGIPGAIIGSLAGAIITERVYSVPGVGGLITEAINKSDNGVIVGWVLFFSTLSVISIVLGDILMAVIDPRISFSTGGR
jgi:oligopeptide transport system permease protein